MRHRRHALIPAHIRTLRATAATPCVAALLVALLTGAAPGPHAGAGGEARAAAVGAYAGTAVKSPTGHGTSHARPSPSAAPAEGADGPLHEAAEAAEAGADSGAFGKHDLYENDPGYDPLEYDYAPSTGERPTTAATGGVSPVLPLGAGMTLIGLGLALIALRLRRT